MGKYSDADIDAMLKRIQENVDKQSSNDIAESAEENTDAVQATEKKSQDELMELIMADIGDDASKKTKSADAEKYDISGFEIEDIDESESTVAENEEAPAPIVEATADEEAEELEELSSVDEISPEEVIKANSEALVEELPDEELEELPDILTRENISDDTEDNVESASNLEDETPLEVSDLTEIFDEVSVENEELVDLAEDSVEEKESDFTPSIEAEEADSDTPSDDEATDDATNEDEALEDVTGAFVKDRWDAVEDNLAKPDAEYASECDRIDDADINLTIALGNKKSLESVIGFVKVRQAKHNFVNPTEKDTVGNIILDYSTKEYRSYEENADIKDRYRKEKKRIGFRLGISAFLFALLAFFELVYSFESISIPYLKEFLNVPLYYGLVSIFIVALSVALSAKKMFWGIIGFFTSSPNYYSTVSFVFLVNLLYSVLNITVFGDGDTLMLNSIVVFGLLLDIVGEYLQISREIMTFKLVSDDRPKIALERIDVTTETIKKESFLTGNDFVIEDVNFVGKYFARSARSPQSYHARYTYTMLTMLLALLVAVVAVTVTQDFAYFVYAFELSILISIPIQFTSLGSLPFYIMSRKLLRLDSAVIGETIDDEYVGPHTVYMDDAEMLGRHGIKIVNLEPHNGFNIVDVNYYFLSIFTKLESPLKNAFGEISEKMKLSDNVQLVSVFQNGIEAIVDSKNKIFIGKYEFMVEKGIQFGKCHNEKPIEKDDVCVMFMSVNGAICSRMSLRYTIAHHFERFAGDMAENRVHVGVRTVDPNITEEMIARLREVESLDIKVMRPTFNDLVPIERRSNSGIITAKNPHMISRILAEGLKVKKVNSVINILWIVYALLGLCSVIAIAVFGVFDKIFPIYIVAYQTIWIIGLAVYIINKFKNRKIK